MFILLPVSANVLFSSFSTLFSYVYARFLSLKVESFLFTFTVFLDLKLYFDALSIAL